MLTSMPHSNRNFVTWRWPLFDAKWSGDQPLSSLEGTTAPRSIKKRCPSNEAMSHKALSHEEVNDKTRRDEVMSQASNDESLNDEVLSKGVFCSSFRPSTFAPYWMSTFATSRCPLTDAKCNGAQQSESCAFTWAPRSSNSRMTSR